MTMTNWDIFGPFVFSFLVAFCVTPFAIYIAPRIGAMDIPKDSRRMHSRAMPRFGGMAIFAGTMVALLGFLHDNPRVMIAALGGTIIYVMGVIDDVKGMKPRAKFLIELGVAILMYYLGLRIEFITNYFGVGTWRFGSILCFVVTILWIVGITNTINLIDGLDGLAAGVASIACISIAYVAYIHGDRYGMLAVCAAMLAVAGGALGFLPYNFNPAKIFMGDSGSLFLGFMLATLSVISPLKRSTLIAVIVPVLVLGIPIFDTFFAILRRRVNRRPIMEADRGHLHHRLMESGYGQRRAVLMLYGTTGIMGMAAVLLSRELVKDSIVLVIIAGIFLYVFLSDPHHKMPKLKAVNIEKEEERARRENQ